jgi:hypothetical protein
MSNKRSRNRKRARRLAAFKTDAKLLNLPIDIRDDILESGDPSHFEIPKDFNDLSKREIDELVMCHCEFCSVDRTPRQVEELLEGVDLRFDTAQPFAVIPARRDSPTLRHILTEGYHTHLLSSPKLAQLVKREGPMAFVKIRQMELHFLVIPD